MAAPTAVPAPALPTEDEDDDSTHITCTCSPDVSLCGFDMTGWDHTDLSDDGPTCIVCSDLIDAPCPRCGE